jgi:hypothetical protein
MQIARNGHTVVRASSVLILFGGEDAKRKKLNDLHMFDLKSFTWLPLHCTWVGSGALSTNLYNIDIHEGFNSHCFVWTEELDHLRDPTM